MKEGIHSDYCLCSRHPHTGYKGTNGECVGRVSERCTQGLGTGLGTLTRQANSGRCACMRPPQPYPLLGVGLAETAPTSNIPAPTLPAPPEPLGSICP